MDFRVEPEADSPRHFHLFGELDLASSPALAEALSPVARGNGDIRLRRVRVIRDYGMFDRAEAPADSRRVHQ